MLSGNCTEALSIQANVTISGSSAKLIKNGIAPLPFPLPALLTQYWYIKSGERVTVRGHAPFYATLGFIGAVFATYTGAPETCNVSTHEFPAGWSFIGRAGSTGNSRTEFSDGQI